MLLTHLIVNSQREASPIFPTQWRVLQNCDTVGLFFSLFLGPWESRVAYLIGTLGQENWAYSVRHIPVGSQGLAVNTCCQAPACGVPMALYLTLSVWYGCGSPLPRSGVQKPIYGSYINYLVSIRNK